MKQFRLTILLLLTGMSVFAQNSWEQKAPFPGTNFTGACFSVNNHGYVATGYDGNNNILNTVWMYNPGNDTWTVKNPFPVAIYGAMSFVINGEAYITGGWINNSGTGNHLLFHYDHVADQWDTLAPYPGTDFYCGISFTLNGKGYVGVGYKPYTNQLWCYDPATNTWSQKASFPGHLRQSGTAFTVQNHAFVGLGTYEPTLDAYDDYYEYIDSSDTWVAAWTFPGGARYAGMGLSANHPQVGLGYDWSSFKNDMWELDPFTMTWSQAPDFGGAPRYGACGFVINNKLYAGAGRAGTNFTDFWKYDCTAPNELRGFIFRDDNSDGIADSNERGINQLLVEIQPSGAIYSTNHAGLFDAAADSGTSSVNILNPPVYYTLASAPAPVNFNGTGMVDSTTVLAYQPTGLFTDLSVNLIAYSSPNPGLRHTYALTYSNKGTLAVDTGHILFVFDSLLSFSQVIPADSMINVTGDSLSFDVYNVKPGDSHVILIEFWTSTIATLGDTVTSTAYINCNVADADSSDNSSANSCAVVGSFDPNDITVSREAITPQEVAAGQWLTYTIRFQNTGTAAARMVSVIDSIETGLDLSTFQMIGSSHPCVLNLEGDRRLKFSFPGISLPDSNANEPMSHGFIQYRVKADYSLQINDQVQNKAAIYFDYNAPVITNTAVTSVVNLTALTERNSSRQIVCYPNPANDVVHFILSPGVKATSATLTDFTGRVVASWNKITSHDLFLPQLQTAIYLLHVITTEGKLYNTSVSVNQR